MSPIHHIAIKDTHPLRIQSSGKRSGKFAGGVISNSAICSVIMIDILHLGTTALIKMLVIPSTLVFFNLPGIGNLRESLASEVLK